jgi:hypothetical protein
MPLLHRFAHRKQVLGAVQGVSAEGSTQDVRERHEISPVQSRRR